ncbi:unnamed protein product, partial [Mesorhabditis spiculigera]
MNSEARPPSAQTPYPLLAESTAYRKVLKQVSAGVLGQHGFDAVPAIGLDSIARVMETYLLALCDGTKHAVESAGRSAPTVTDAMVSFANLGIDQEAFIQHCYRNKNEVVSIPTPRQENPQRTQNTLQVGKTRLHPPHVPESLPPFPDPHTYIKTEICADPEISYEKVRDQMAQGQRDAVRNIVDLMQRQYPSTCLFRDYMEQTKKWAEKTVVEGEERRRREKQRRGLANSNSGAAHIKTEQSDDAMEIGGSDVAEGSRTGRHLYEDDDQYGLPENVSTLIRRKIPVYCSILDLQPEFRPYLNCLATDDDAKDDDGDLKREPVKRKAKDEASENSDNPFFRQPRVAQEPVRVKSEGSEMET